MTRLEACRAAHVRYLEAAQAYRNGMISNLELEWARQAYATAKRRLYRRKSH